MAIHTTYTEARANLARLWDQATHDRETVIISRRGADDVAMIAADELSSLQETAHLLRSPANAARLLTALGRALKNEGEAVTIEEIRQEVGLADEA
jgi:antitoxin YefM